jgi:hypothetical protein
MSRTSEEPSRRADSSRTLLWLRCTAAHRWIRIGGYEFFEAGGLPALKPC